MIRKRQKKALPWRRRENQAICIFFLRARRERERERRKHTKNIEKRYAIDYGDRWYS